MAASYTESATLVPDIPASYAFPTSVFHIDGSSTGITAQVRFAQAARKERNEAESEPVVPFKDTGVAMTPAVMTVINLFYEGRQVPLGFLPPDETARATHYYYWDATVTHPVSLCVMIMHAFLSTTLMYILRFVLL